MSSMGNMPSGAQAIADTQRWLERAVIGLNLCPFAKAEHVHGRIRFCVSDAQDRAALLENLRAELLFLQAADPAQTETTLLLHPQVLNEFLEYNDFLHDADALLESMALDGVFQIASFHPQYQFALTAADDIGNYSNRSPYPCLHLLREASVERAVAAFAEAEHIYERNLLTLERLGLAGWNTLMAKA